MPPSQSLPWIDPLELAASIDEPYWVLLYSGVKTTYSGRYSYLACQLSERIESNDFASLEKKLTGHTGRFDNAWFGYLGYGLKDSMEKLAPDSPNWISLPHLCMMQFKAIIEFDHDTHTICVRSGQPNLGFLRRKPKKKTVYPAGVTSLRSNMTRAAYLEKVAQIVEHIRNGDLYQANLTRKFMGDFNESPEPFALFKKLCDASPAPYSAYLRLGDAHILSSSPEQFLQVSAQGHIKTRPIKGTAPRADDPALDRASSDALASSPKDRAENLMIVDLMRNDLSRSSVPGSVQVSNLFEVTSHANVHHMSSTITSIKRPGCSALDAVKYSFPPGSMTGAPKISAMNLCSEMEVLERGVYSGAIGWLGGDGSAELSVVIRTLLIKGKRFEFQVGGGIVADSDPEKELMETIDKSKGILAALGLSIGETAF